MPNRAFPFKVGMIQSNYIPWRGYFDFIDDVDLFIFYDDVQYTHKDWRNRNKVKTINGTEWLSVPVRHSRDTLINEAEIDYSSRWVDVHIRKIAINYARAPYFDKYAAAFFELLASRPRTISELNVATCKWMMQCLDISTEIRLSSDFGISGSKFERPLKILKSIGATLYLSGPNAKPYTIASDFRDAGIALEYKSYEYRPYPQLHGPFDGAVSCLDLLLNSGPHAREYLKSLVPNERAIKAT